MRLRKISRKKGNRELLVKNLTTSLIIYERITTTHAKAKLAQVYIEKIISRIKKLDNVAGLRLAMEKLGNMNSAKKLIEVLKHNFKNKTSGFTRIVRVGPRKGDAADMVIIELTVKTEESHEKQKAENTKKQPDKIK